MQRMVIDSPVDEKEVVEVLDLINQRQLVDLFGVTTLTITTWRNKFQLPYVRIPSVGNDSIRYHLDKVVKWAKANNKPMDQQVLKQLMTANSPS